MASPLIFGFLYPVCAYVYVRKYVHTMYAPVSVCVCVCVSVSVSVSVQML